MHELALDFVKEAGPGALLRLPLDDGALLAWFDAGSAPRWLAKSAHNPAGCRRLRHEAQALGWLEPHAVALAIPRLIGWSDRDGECCLVQSGIPGVPLRPSRSAAAAALGWLRRFQHRMPAPRLLPLDELARQFASEMDRLPDPDGLGARLRPHFHECPQSAPAAPVHGDFWTGNVLRAPGGAIGVVDWSEFDSGSALDDPLTFLGLLEPERWLASLLDPGPCRNWLRQWAGQAGYGPPLARFAFYWHCARRLRWELGFALQTRDAGERAAARVRWSARLAALAQRGWPDPFSGA